jgi:hypothetical protein
MLIINWLKSLNKSKTGRFNQLNGRACLSIGRCILKLSERKISLKENYRADASKLI